MQIKSTRHLLDIFEPGSLDTVWMRFEAGAPLGAISRGDIINPGMWPDSQSPMKLLRVINLVHGFWEKDSVVTHQTIAFTAEVAGDDDVLLGRDVAIGASF